MANIHFEIRENDLVNLFRENNLNVVRLSFHKNHETGKPKGTGICEFMTPMEASFAVQRLSGFEFKGRPIRFEMANVNQNQRSANQH